MPKLKIVIGEDRSEVDIPEEMMIATDEQIVSYVRETLHRELPDNTVIERSAEAIVLHPEAVYG